MANNHKYNKVRIIEIQYGTVDQYGSCLIILKQYAKLF